MRCYGKITKKKLALKTALKISAVFLVENKIPGGFFHLVLFFHAGFMRLKTRGRLENCDAWNFVDL